MGPARKRIKNKLKLVFYLNSYRHDWDNGCIRAPAVIFFCGTFGRQFLYRKKVFESRIHNKLCKQELGVEIQWWGLLSCPLGDKASLKPGNAYPTCFSSFCVFLEAFHMITNQLCMQVQRAICHKFCSAIKQP